MSAGEFELPWDSQPQEAVGLSDFAQSLLCESVLLPSVSSSLDLQGQLNSVASSGSTVASPAGIARSYSNQGDIYATEGLLDPTNGYWWCCHGHFSAVGTWSGLMTRTSDDGTGIGWNWQRVSFTDALRVYAGNSFVNIGTLNALLDTVNRTWVATWRSNGDLRLWRDGVLVRSGTLAVTPTYVSGQGRIRPFQSRDVTLSSGQWHLLAFGAGRALTDTEGQILSADPWQLFAPQQIDVPRAAGGGRPTLSALARTNPLRPRYTWTP
jgi:hypothetical protein